MALVLADRVKDTTTSVGTGTITLDNTPPASFQSFAAIGNGNTTYYTIANDTDWEVGIGTYTSSGTTLSRDTVLASSAGGTTKVSFPVGQKTVFVTLPAERTVYSGGSIAQALPTPGAIGQVLISDGTAWVSGRSPGISTAKAYYFSSF